MSELFPFDKENVIKAYRELLSYNGQETTPLLKDFLFDVLVHYINREGISESYLAEVTNNIKLLFDFLTNANKGGAELC